MNGYIPGVFGLLNGIISWRMIGFGSRIEFITCGSFEYHGGFWSVAVAGGRIASSWRTFCLALWVLFWSLIGSLVIWRSSDCDDLHCSWKSTAAWCWERWHWVGFWFFWYCYALECIIRGSFSLNDCMMPWRVSLMFYSGWQFVPSLCGLVYSDPKRHYTM